MDADKKIRKELTAKQRAIIGARELKEYLYSKRANLTHDEINHLINDLAVKVYEMAYENGWDDRNYVTKARKSEMRSRVTKYFNDFYEKYGGKLPVKVMEEIYYLYDIAREQRYFNVNVPIEVQINNREIY